jgi:hypothetical protein
MPRIQQGYVISALIPSASFNTLMHLKQQPTSHPTCMNHQTPVILSTCAINDGKAIAKLFAKDLKRLPRASCQLYGERMRGLFRLAVDSGDYKLLAAKARERRVAEEKFKREVGELKRQLIGSGQGGMGVERDIEREIERKEEEWRRWE